MDLEYKIITSSGGVTPTDEDGVVEALVSVTGIKDNVGDIIEPGAYSRTLKERKPKGAWAHEWQTPVSKARDIKELMPGDSSLPKTLPNGDPWPKEAGALYVKAEFNLNTTAGKDAYENVKFFGEDCEWSIGYRVPKGGATKDAKTGIRHIKDLNLYEFSPVLFGAASNARSLPMAGAIKSLFESDNEFKAYVMETIEHKGEEEPEVEEKTEFDDEGVSDEALEASVKSIEDEEAEEKVIEERSEPRTVTLNAVSIDQLKHLRDEIDAVLGIALQIDEKTEEPVEIESKSVSEALDDITDSGAELSRKFLFDVIAFERASEDEKKTAAIALLDSINDELDASDTKSELLLKTLAKSIGDSFDVEEKAEEEEEVTDDEAKSDEAEPVVEEKKTVKLTDEEYKALFG